MAVQPLRGELTRRGEHGERDRQVEAGALLAQLGRREVDRQPAKGELELGGRDPAPDALLRLLARAVGETDDRERRDAVLDVRLHLDALWLEPDECMRDRACEHTATLATEVARLCADCVPNASRTIEPYGSRR